MHLQYRSNYRTQPAEELLPLMGGCWKIHLSVHTVRMDANRLSGSSVVRRCCFKLTTNDGCVWREARHMLTTLLRSNR